VFLARQGESKQNIKNEITQRFAYGLDRTLDEIRPTYHFDVSCQGSVPQSIIAFLESTSYEDAIRKGLVAFTVPEFDEFLKRVSAVH